MARYLFQAAHTPEECLATLDGALAQGRDTLARYDFGCAVGDHTNHTCYCSLEADNEAVARAMVGDPIGNKGQIVEVGKFTEAQIRSFHAA